MKTPSPVEDLSRLIVLIDYRLVHVARWPDPKEPKDDHESWNRRQRELDAIVADLVKFERARLSSTNGADTITLAGIRSSATSGPHGLLRNWQAAARRALLRAEHEQPREAAE